MGTVVYLKGATAGYADRTAAPMRQPVGRPASQCVSVGEATRNLLEKLMFHGRLTDS